MRARLCVTALLAFSSIAAVVPALGAQSDRYNDGLVAADYLRVSGGIMSPVNPQGSLRDWTRGGIASVVWEGWQAGGAGGGVGRLGFGLGIDYGRLPLNEQQFISDFTSASGGKATSASASSATVFSIGTNLRIRIPAPMIMPSIMVGFSYLDFHPSTINYVSAGASGSATQQHRRGAAFSVGGGLDKHVYDKVAIFGEALYTYGFTGLGQGIANPNGNCAANGCDVLKNTTLGTIRGGLRVQMGR